MANPAENEQAVEEKPAEQTESATPDVEEAEDQDQEDENGIEEEAGAIPHPADRLNECIEDVNDQIKRLESRNAGNLKYELINNLYPILGKALDAMVDFIDNIDEGEGEGDEVDEEIQKQIEAAQKEALDICQTIVKLNESTDLINTTTSADFQKIVAWARKTIASAEAAAAQAK